MVIEYLILAAIVAAAFFVGMFAGALLVLPKLERAENELKKIKMARRK